MLFVVVSGCFFGQSTRRCSNSPIKNAGVPPCLKVFFVVVFEDFVGRVQGGAARGLKKKKNEHLLPFKAAFCDCLSMIFGVVSQSLQNGMLPSLSTY